MVLYTCILYVCARKGNCNGFFQFGCTIRNEIKYSGTRAVIIHIPVEKNECFFNVERSEGTIGFIQWCGFFLRVLFYVITFLDRWSALKVLRCTLSIYRVEIEHILYFREFIFLFFPRSSLKNAYKKTVLTVFMTPANCLFKKKNVYIIFRELSSA